LIALLVMLRRFLHVIRDAWKSDEAFRTLLAVVVSLLLSGTVFFTIVYIFVGLGVIGGFINVLAKHTFARRMRGAGASEDKEGAPSS